MPRRKVLAGIAAAAVLTGFDPIARTWVRSAEASDGCPSFPFHHLPQLDGTVYSDLATREADAVDNGHIKRKLPAAVLRPGSVEDIVKMVKFCRKHDIKVAARGQGHTTFGHALTCGLVIETATLATIHHIGDDGAEVDAGVQWYNLIIASAEQGLTPPVITGYTQLSIGGTLSVGGVSSTGGRGFQIDRVQWLDVVTGKGKLERCSETQHKKLFEAVLGGLGQFGIIVRAKVHLVPAPAFVRLYNLVYFDDSQMLADLRTLAERDECDDLFNLWFPAGPSSFGSQLNATVYYNDPGDPPDNDFVLRDLSQPPEAATFVDIPYVPFVLRVDGVFDFYKITYDWDNLIKPWFDVFLPDSTVEQYVTDVLPTLTPADVGTTGFMLLFPQRRSALTRELYPLPDDDCSDFIYLFDILTSSELPGPDPAWTEAMLDRNRTLFEQARDLGGTRYSIGSLRFSHSDWERQYGDKWGEFEDRKDKYDPDNILTPGLEIFSD